MKNLFQFFKYRKSSSLFTTLVQWNPYHRTQFLLCKVVISEHEFKRVFFFSNLAIYLIFIWNYTIFINEKNKNPNLSIYLIFIWDYTIFINKKIKTLCWWVWILRLYWMWIWGWLVICSIQTKVVLLLTYLSKSTIHVYLYLIS